LTGAVPTLSDAGVGDPAHVEEIAAALGGQPLAQVLVTHGHPDHVAGLPALAARWPSLRVIQSGGGRYSRIDAGNATLEVIPTPGHAPDHLAFFDRQSGDVFTGDLVRAEGTIVIPASKGGDLQQYLDSLRAIRALGPKRLLPGHGPIVDDADGLIERYLRHREERDAQIRAAVAAGMRTPAEIVARVYGPLPSALRAAAEDTVLAHLKRGQAPF
jgi:glyoxylase-like metal-dependent hydrolase (beta-lactamase superfamily II)